MKNAIGSPYFVMPGRASHARQHYLKSRPFSREQLDIHELLRTSHNRSNFKLTTTSLQHPLARCSNTLHECISVHFTKSSCSGNYTWLPKHRRLYNRNYMSVIQCDIDNPSACILKSVFWFNIDFKQWTSDARCYGLLLYTLALHTLCLLHWLILTTCIIFGCSSH